MDQVAYYWIRKAKNNTRLSLLREQNPDINWQTGEFKWRNQTFQVPKGHRLNPMQLAKALV